MWPLEVDGLPREEAHVFRILGRDLVMRQVEMEVERRDAIEKPECVQISVGGQRRDVLGAFDQCWPKAVLVDDRYLERLHQRACVLAESLLSRNQWIPMVRILHLALLQIAGEADVVMRSDQQARVFAFQPLEDRGDFFRRRLLLGYKVVQAEYQEGIRVRQDPLVNRKPVTSLVDALEHRDRMTGRLAHDLLKAQ